MGEKYDSNKNLIPYSRRLRKEMTKEEKHLWYDCLVKMPLKFRRQHIIGNYIVDFYCSKAQIVVELDGEHHYTDAKQRFSDEQRDIFLKNLGITVLRYSNYDIHKRFRDVCDDIFNHISKYV